MIKPMTILLSQPSIEWLSICSEIVAWIVLCVRKMTPKTERIYDDLSRDVIFPFVVSTILDIRCKEDRRKASWWDDVELPDSTCLAAGLEHLYSIIASCILLTISKFSDMLHERNRGMGPCCFTYSCVYWLASNCSSRASEQRHPSSSHYRKIWT